MTTFEVLTIFPEMITDYAKVSIVARAIQKNYIAIKPRDLRASTNDPHKTVDDRPYGGGVGMVLKADIIQKALVSMKADKHAKVLKRKKTRVVLVCPQGQVFTQKVAQRLAKYERIVFVSGRYEGFDERVRTLVDEELSIGDYIVMGGELPALVMIESIARCIPGVVGKFESTENESFSDPLLLEYPQYTRPEVLTIGKRTMRVPKVLLSGNHAQIASFRADAALKRTKKRRPDLLRSGIEGKL